MSVKIVIRKVSPRRVAQYLAKIGEVMSAGNWYDFVEVYPEEAEA